MTYRHAHLNIQSTRNFKKLVTVKIVIVVTSMGSLGVQVETGHTGACEMYGKVLFLCLSDSCFTL